MIEVESLVSFVRVRKHFFSKSGRLDVLEDITFDVGADEIVALVGPSGAGKSTILNLISGLLVPDGGEVTRRCTFGYMFQKDNLFGWRTVLSNVLLGLEIKGRISRSDRDYAQSLLVKYGLGEFIDSYPDTLSGGMRQRVALIRTLALKPDLLLLDEPFSALDYMTRLKLEDDVAAIIHSEHKSALIVTHDISEALSLSDRVVSISGRPARVKAVHDIGAAFGPDRPSPTKTRTLKAFQTVFDEIYTELT